MDVFENLSTRAIVMSTPHKVHDLIPFLRFFTPILLTLVGYFVTEMKNSLDELGSQTDQQTRSIQDLTTRIAILETKGTQSEKVIDDRLNKIETSIERMSHRLRAVENGKAFENGRN